MLGRSHPGGRVLFAGRFVVGAAADSIEKYQKRLGEAFTSDLLALLMNTLCPSGGLCRGCSRAGVFS